MNKHATSVQFNGSQRRSWSSLALKFGKALVAQRLPFAFSVWPATRKRQVSSCPLLVAAWLPARTTGEHLWMWYPHFDRVLCLWKSKIQAKGLDTCRAGTEGKLPSRCCWTTMLIILDHWPCWRRLVGVEVQWLLKGTMLVTPACCKRHTLLLKTVQWTESSASTVRSLHSLAPN